MTEHNLEKVVVIGMGYVGFPLACAIAKTGKYEVYGLDTDSGKVDSINRKISPIDDKRALEDVKEVELHATSDPSVIKNASYVIICVPTPVNGKKKPDLTPVIKAAEVISSNIRKSQSIILESTVNPGVCEEVVLPILEKSGLKGGIDFELAHCPERVNPGDLNWNVYNIPRNIGALTQDGRKRIADFYRSFVNASINEVSSLKVAEATKILENTFRDVNIALVNQISPLFDRMGIDIMEVIKSSSNKPFAFMAHYPGCGVGGHCIPVDPYYLIDKAESYGFNLRLLRAARKVNNSMPGYTISKLMIGLQKMGISSLKGVKIGLLGLSYKANTSDLRESPALEIQKHLKKLGAHVLSYDPYCLENSNSDFETIIKECRGL